MSAAALPARTAIDLSGRTVLVTGAGSGIGEGIATVLGRAGATVAVNDVNASAAGAVADGINADGGTAFSLAGDITDEDAADEIVRLTAERGGGLDGLVNNAGITGPRSIDDIGRSDWERVLSVNLWAPFALTVRAAPYLRRSAGGRVVNIASIAGTRVSVLGGAAYTSSKAGLIGLTRHLAMELAQDGITVNAILPGVTMTPLVAANTDAGSLEDIRRTVPAGRIGSPEDIGWLAVYLLSDLSGYVSGTATEIDGALTVLPGDFSSYQGVRTEGTRTEERASA